MDRRYAGQYVQFYLVARVIHGSSYVSQFSFGIPASSSTILDYYNTLWAIYQVEIYSVFYRVTHSAPQFDAMPH